MSAAVTGMLGMVGPMLPPIIGIMVFLALRRKGVRTKERAEMGVEKNRARLSETEHDLTETAPRVEVAEKREVEEVIHMMDLVKGLESRVKIEEDIFNRVRKLLKEEESEDLQTSGKGFPEAREIMELCNSENQILDEVWKLLLSSDEITKRIVSYMKKENKIIAKDTHRFAFADNEARADGAEGKTEIKSVNKELDEIRSEEIELGAVISDEQRIRDEIGRIRKRTRRVQDMNKDLIEEAQSRKERVNIEEKELKEMRETVHRKKTLIEGIVLGLRTISIYDERAEHETEKTVADAKAEMKV